MAKRKKTAVTHPFEPGTPPKLGQLLPPDAPDAMPPVQVLRDAVHIALAPVYAAEDLRPGQPVGFVKPGNTQLVGQSVLIIGVIDPYLACHYVKKGERCWLFIMPGTIMGLRHEWTHPEFDQTYKLIEAFAKKIDYPVEDLMEAANKWVETGEETHLDFDSPYAERGEWASFWENFTALTGKHVENPTTEGIFVCAC